MNGVTRFLSRREKRASSDKPAPSKPRSVATDLYGVFAEDNPNKKTEKEEKKVKAIMHRLGAIGITSLKEAQVEYALRSKYADGDAEKAYELLVLFEDSVEGIVREYNPDVKILGAENCENVTCYLDSLLFAMFAKLDSFEAILFDNFTDAPRKKLAGLLRLWVNLLRSGKLITTDITRHLQDALGNCGWAEATKICQQDASEAFTFITGKLELPLLTLKMDLYHAGTEDKDDDHKFVNERLLEVAIPAPSPEAGNTVTLEDCLETYFNNRIEVKRHLQRRNTIRSIKSVDGSKDQELRIDTVEISPRPSSTPPLTPSSTISPVTSRPTIDRCRRTDSIFSERFITLNGEPSEKKLLDEVSSPTTGRPRGGSIRKEVMMPAWQFFSLIPWYTDNAPLNDAQVAAHFSTKRPVLGICLKRYYMSPSGTPQRLDTFVDIPLEIALPHFVSDDRMTEAGPLFGNFKLSLQSMVCHRGVSVDSGQYITLVRGDIPDDDGNSTGEADVSSDCPVPWILFDDLAPERVTSVNVREELKKESPYLLFYRVEPIDDTWPRGDPPSYAEANSEAATGRPLADIDFTTKTEGSTIGTSTTNPSMLTLGTASSLADSAVPVTTVSRSSSTENLPETSNGSAKALSVLADTTDFAMRGPSLDLPRPDEAPRGRSSTSSDHRRSIAFDDSGIPGGGSTSNNTAPTTPAEEKKGGFFSGSRRGSKAGKPPKSRSRPPSQSGENRLSATFTLLASRMSKDKLAPPSSEGTKTPAEEDPPSISRENESDEKENAPTPSEKSAGLGRSKSKKKKDKRPKSVALMTDLDFEKMKGKRPDRECVVM